MCRPLRRLAFVAHRLGLLADGAIDHPRELFVDDRRLLQRSQIDHVVHAIDQRDQSEATPGLGRCLAWRLARRGHGLRRGSGLRRRRGLLRGMCDLRDLRDLRGLLSGGVSLPLRGLLLRLRRRQRTIRQHCGAVLHPLIADVGNARRRRHARRNRASVRASIRASIDARQALALVRIALQREVTGRIGAGIGSGRRRRPTPFQRPRYAARSAARPAALGSAAAAEAACVPYLPATVARSGWCTSRRRPRLARRRSSRAGGRSRRCRSCRPRGRSSPARSCGR